MVKKTIGVILVTIILALIVLILMGVIDIKTIIQLEGFTSAYSLTSLI